MENKKTNCFVTHFKPTIFDIIMLGYLVTTSNLGTYTMIILTNKFIVRKYAYKIKIIDIS